MSTSFSGINRYFFLLIFVAFAFRLSGKEVSAFNNLSFNCSDSVQSYSILISGHLHGASTNVSGFPASSILASIDTINKYKPACFITLGDVFLDVNEQIVKNYNLSLFNKLRTPIFNAVGNHDISGDLYENYFGKTWLEFTCHSEGFIILNTEINDGSIKNGQAEFLTNTLLKYSKDSSVKNIFIFSHRPVWAENNPVYENVFNDNSRTEFGKNNFQEFVRPLLSKISSNKNIYWISGSLGPTAYSFFYNKENDSKITFMATAIRDLPRDAILKVDIKDSKVSFQGISLTGQPLKKIEQYDIELWSDQPKYNADFNIRLFPLYLKQMILHHYFWIGFFLSLSIFGVIFLIRRR